MYNYARRKYATERKKGQKTSCLVCPTPPNAIVTTPSPKYLQCVHIVPVRHLCGLRSEPEAGSALGAVENDVLALEENVAVDAETKLRVSGLETAEASWTLC